MSEILDWVVATSLVPKSDPTRRVGGYTCTITALRLLSHFGRPGFHALAESVEEKVRSIDSISAGTPSAINKFVLKTQDMAWSGR